MSYRVDSYDPAGGLLDEEVDAGGNYVVRHWRGQLPLVQSYWLNGFLANLVIGAVGAALLALEQTGKSLRLIAAAFIIYAVLFLLIRIWTVVGVWRSAGRHAARGGAAGWGFAARAIIVVGLFATLVQLPSLGAQAKEFGLIAIGRDPLGPAPTMTLAASGRQLEIKGILSAGTADRFQQALDAAPAARLVVLDSDGGRVFEALRMAELIRIRGMSTRVEQHCASACTLLLLAGKERTAHRFAEIGFHQPDFPGLSDQQRTSIIADNRQDYVKAGIDSRFVDRAMSTPPADMWYPTHAELVEAGVLSDEVVILGGSDSERQRLLEVLARIDREINAGNGTMVDELTRLSGSRLTGTQLRLRYDLTRAFSDQEAAALQSNLQTNLREDICNSPKRTMIETGASFGFDYFTPNGQRAASVTIDNCGGAAG